MRITVYKLHKILEKMIEDGNGKRPVCINKETFNHPLEGDGVSILDVLSVSVESITISDGDGFTATNKDGSEKRKTVIILNGIDA